MNKETKAEAKNIRAEPFSVWAAIVIVMGSCRSIAPGNLPSSSGAWSQNDFANCRSNARSPSVSFSAAV
ncbi:MAG: hypothetical protein EXS35_03540 [Pedosphaera sp.]|nr:hypothetical protein [Pedosphaera sp.]